jgi:hypothetical protein
MEMAYAATARTFAWHQDALGSRQVEIASARKQKQMPASFRAFTVLAAATTMFANVASAADYSVEKSHRVYNRAHYGYWLVHAPSELIAGMRGASPLSVPFFGYGWLPGPVHYYRSSNGPCCLSENEPAISVKY